MAWKLVDVCYAAHSLCYQGARLYKHRLWLLYVRRIALYVTCHKRRSAGLRLTLVRGSLPPGRDAPGKWCCHSPGHRPQLPGQAALECLLQRAVGLGGRGRTPCPPGFQAGSGTATTGGRADRHWTSRSPLADAAPPKLPGHPRSCAAGQYSTANRSYDVPQIIRPHPRSVAMPCVDG
jgi:hypothetical protein